MEIKEQLEGLVAKMDGRLENATGALKTEITGLIEELKNASAEADVVKALEDRVSEMEIKAAKVSKSIEKAKGGMSFGEAITKSLEDNKDKIAAVAKGETQWTKFELKAVGNISSSNISGGDVPQADRLSGFDAIASRTPRLIDLMSQRSTSSDKVEWVYQSGKEGAAGQTAEGAAKNQIDFDWVVGSEDVVKTTAYIKVTDEMLAKGAVVSQEINNELVREVFKVAELGAYSGNGTAPNMRGITSVASAFSAATVGANSVDNANQIDVLTVAMAQIKIAQEGDANPNAILMHPADVAKLKLEKLSASDKRYVGRLLAAGSGLSLDGVPILETTLVTAGDYLIGDFNCAEFVQREGMMIEIGYDSDDFTKNLRTIRCELRAAVVVRNNKRSAFVAGDFATDQAALETA